MNAIVNATMTGAVSSRFAPQPGQELANDLAGGITGGYGLIGFRGKVWSIRHKGVEQQLMRDDGDGPRGSIDVVILKANPHLSKNWYENGFVEGSNAPPDCSSANGVYPDPNVPKKQSNVCLTCPKNAWGSATGGSGKGKACGDHRRMAVVPVADIKNELFGGPLLLRCPAASLQDLAAFSQKLAQLGYPYYAVAVKIGFDPAESFPKFTFSAIRPLTDGEADMVIEHQAGDAVGRVIADAVDPAAAATAQLAPPPADPATAALPPRTATPAPAPVVAQPVPVAPTPAPAAPASAGGFGAAAPVPQAAGAAPAATVVQPAPAQPVAPSAPPPVQPTPAPASAPVTVPAATGGAPVMTGFGPTTAAEPQPQSFAGAADGTRPVDNAVNTAFEADLDSKLADLLGAATPAAG